MKKDNTKIALIVILIILLFFAGFYIRKTFLKEKEPEVIGESEYTFNNHNFIKVDNLWYTLVKSIDERFLIEIALHFGPKELIDYPISGNLSNFIPVENGYISFDPLEPELGYILIANGELSLTLAKAFKAVQDKPLNLTTVCSRDDYKTCSKYPILNCNNTNDTIIYLRQINDSRIVVEDNCIIIQGKNEDLLKGVDRLMYSWFKILP